MLGKKAQKVVNLTPDFQTCGRLAQSGERGVRKKMTCGIVKAFIPRGIPAISVTYI
ncbi:MAG: hypothetical protein KAW19_01920 [Candidatus Aminicenantes bacterium]|nr:hypothetical protein [Candidatus Aminicenantes bacterium]